MSKEKNCTTLLPREKEMDQVSPRASVRLQRKQQGNLRPVHHMDVKKGKARIDQLSTPRFRVTGNDCNGTQHGFGYGESPRMSRDEHIAFDAEQKMFKRLQEHPSGREAQAQAADEAKRGRGLALPAVPKLPSALSLLTSLEESMSSARRGQTRMCGTGEHEKTGIAGLMLANSEYRDDTCCITGTKLQVHELQNTEVPRAQVDSARFPISIPTSGRRKQQQLNLSLNSSGGGGGGGDDSSSSELPSPSGSSARGNVRVIAPAPSAVRSLAISGIDTSRSSASRPSAPQYFQQEQVRSTRHGSLKHPETHVLSQPGKKSGQFLSASEQFDSNTRGLHNASTYVLEDKLRKKATDELRISKCGWNEDAVVARAQVEIDFKKARNEKRVEVKRQARLDYEARVNAGL